MPSSQSLITAYRLIPQFYEVLEEIKTECDAEIEDLEKDLIQLKDKRRREKESEQRNMLATRKLKSCKVAADNLLKSLKEMDLFVNGGI